MKEGAPPDYRLPVRAWLDNRFLGRWIGRQGPTKWPPRSPDLTSCDLFLWGWATDKVGLSKPKTQDELEQQILDTFAAVPLDCLRKRAESMSYM
jgi:hypothetical protein